MSAIQALDYIWATTNASKPERLRPAPLSGAAFYRKHTEGVLRRYLQISMSMGRPPCVLGDGVFRGRASSSRVRNFEDAVVFVIDVERCLKRLDAPALELVVRIALQEYTQMEAAELTGQSVRSVIRKYADALDRLTGIMGDADLFDTRLSFYCQEADRRR